MNVLITGASGSGTTTLGKYTAYRLKWNFIDADDYYWLPTDPPYEKERNREERLKMILDEINKYDSNVIAGSVMEWGDELEDLFSLTVKPKKVQITRELYEIKCKRWRKHWPRLKIIPWDGNS